jgi:CheY-like chemotaxis protein
VHNLPVILVVEDDRLVQTVVEDSLTEGGFEIVLASSGENAVELLDTSQGKYRALVFSGEAGSTAGMSPSTLEK